MFAYLLLLLLLLFVQREFKVKFILLLKVHLNANIYHKY